MEEEQTTIGDPLEHIVLHSPMREEDFLLEMGMLIERAKHNGGQYEDILAIMKESLAGYLPKRIIEDKPESKANRTREMQKSQILGFLEANSNMYLTAQEVADWGAKHPELGKSMRYRSYTSGLLGELNQEGRSAVVKEGKLARYTPLELAVADALKIPNLGNDLLQLSQYLNTRPDQIAGTHAYKFWSQFRG